MNGPGNSNNNCSSLTQGHKRASGSKNSKLGVRQSVNFVRSGKDRSFSSFGQPMAKILGKCIKEGLLQPPEPRPLPNPLPANSILGLTVNFTKAEGMILTIVNA